MGENRMKWLGVPILCLLLAALAVLPVNADNGATAVRSIDPDAVFPGVAVTVQVQITAIEPLNGFMLIETPPAGWTVTPVDSAGATFKADEVRWLWLETLPAGASRTVVYRLTVRDDVAPGTYPVSGLVKSYGIDDVTVGGESIVTVAGLVPPAVTVSAATQVTQNSATLRGNLDTMGDYTEVRVRFQWGTTPAYGTNTPWQTMTAVGAFTHPLTHLTLDTQYHFRVQVETVAPANTVSVFSDDMAFATPVGPWYYQWTEDGVIDDDEVLEAVYCWLTGTPKNGHVLTDDDILWLVFCWLTGEVVPYPD